MIFAALTLLACQGGSASVSELTLDDTSNEPANLRVGAGFTEQVVATGINAPSAIAPAPDGRVFVADRNGSIYVLASGTSRPTRVAHLSVNTRGDRGVLGVAVGPDFASHPALYVLYTASAPFAHPRLSRFDASGASLKAEKVLVDFERSYDTYDVGGGLTFGPDGDLYLALGDDGFGFNAQDLTTVYGKVLRLAADGSVPAGNPFANHKGANAAIWALGFRNPSPAFLADGTLVVTDEGEDLQEVNLVTAGKNFGWPRYEGPSSSRSMVNPALSYPASSWGTCSLRGVAYAGGQFPASYQGLYLFSDACNGRIRAIDFKAGKVSSFARSIVGASAIAVGVDGTLLAASADEGSVHQVAYRSGAPTAPSIVTQPADLTLAAGASASFSVSVSGSAPLSFQWLRNGQAISGETSSALTFTAVAADDGASFSVTVSNPVGSVTSASAKLSVTPSATAPSITTQPQPQTVTAGQSASFTVAATGTGPLSFQWRRDAIAISGATSSTFTFTAAQSDNGATYDVVVSNTAGSVTSDAAALTVTPKVTAPAITTQPQDATVTAGQPASFSVSASGTGPLAYQWRKNGTALPQETAASLSFTAAAGDSGSTFDVVVSNGAGSVTSRAARLTVNAAPVAPSITTQPASVSVTDGQRATFTVAASGSAPMSYQWRKDGVAVSGAISASWTFTAALADNGSKIDVLVANAAGSVTSDPANLSVTAAVKAPAITAQPQSVTVSEGSPASFTVEASGTGPLSYQWSRGGKAISGATSATYTFTAALADSGASFTVAVSNSAGSVTSAAATLTVNAVIVAPSITSQPKAVTVTSGQAASFSVTASGSAPLKYQWRKNGAAISGASAASESFTTVDSDNGATIDVIVSNSAGSVTSNAVTLTVNSAVVAPSITSQPASVTVAVGQTATFSVTATGTSLSYQWKRGGTAIASATSASYSLTAAATDDGASFEVVVSNSAGSVTSSAATLSLSAPAVSYSKEIQPIWQKYCNGCHIGGGGAGGLKLDAAVSYTAIFNKPSNCSTSILEVKAGAPSSSEMWLTMADDPGECGGVMPPGAKGGLRVSDPAAFQLVTTWINQGAPNN